MLILLIALPLLTGLAAALPFPSRRGRLTFLLTMQIIETALVVWTLVSGRSYATNIWHLTESLTIAMKLDGVAAVFSVLTAVAWLLALIYSVEYMSHSQNEARFYVFLFLSEGMLLGTAFSADFVSMYVFYELTSLCSMPLVLHELTHDAVTGAMKYLYYSIGGAFFVLFGIVVLYTNTSTLDFAPGGTLIAGQHTGLELLAVFFVVLGFGTKAGLFPMHNWLPSAPPVAPAPASALLSGIITKAGVIGIIRVLYFIAGPSVLRGTWVQTACLVLALGTVFMGSMLAYGERDFKKRLAYSSISQISYVLTALFLLTEDGLTGGLLQVFFHAWAKIGLFLIAGVIIHLAGLRNVEDFRGLGRRLPVTFLCLVFVSLSLVGIPPFGGFVSKWAISLAALDGLGGPLAYLIPAVLLIADPKALKMVDYPLLLTFVFFFVFAGNMARIDAVRDLLGALMSRDTLLFSTLSCQFISNVPSAILLSHFTDNYRELLLGVNIGGTGTLIASLASLITFREYVKHDPGRNKYYIGVYSAFNLAFLGLLLAFTMLTR